MDKAATSVSDCICETLGEFAIIPMGDAEGRDQLLFETLEEVCKHGDDKWWLYASTCRACGQSWMIAQDERIHDNFYLKRVDAETVQQIASEGNWPPDFLTYEQVLRIGSDSGQICRFFDLQSPALTWTVEELQRERPSISPQEIAYLLSIPDEAAARLMDS